MISVFSAMSHVKTGFTGFPTQTAPLILVTKVKPKDCGALHNKINTQTYKVT